MSVKKKLTLSVEKNPHRRPVRLGGAEIHLVRQPFEQRQPISAEAFSPGPIGARRADREHVLRGKAFPLVLHRDGDLGLVVFERDEEVGFLRLSMTDRAGAQFRDNVSTSSMVVFTRMSSRRQRLGSRVVRM